MNLFRSSKPALSIRGIHLDLKGLPPTPKRLMEILDILKAVRINFVLVEWEDMFPWEKYPELRNKTAYSKAVVHKFFEKAEKLSIQLIPLVQSFGHMENVLLKKRFAHLREIPNHHWDLCPSHPQSREVIFHMIDDILKMHQGKIQYLHLGGDEVWSLGSCRKCKAKIKKHGKDHLYLEHIHPILKYVKEKNIEPILWDDMMRSWPLASLRNLASKASLMCWSYAADPFVWYKKDCLDNFQKAGIKLWGASAFKGGDGAFVDLCNLQNRTANTLVWTQEAKKRRFIGMVATGWSRYGTTYGPCDGLEPSLDSLILTGSIFWDGSLPKNYREEAWSFLQSSKMKKLAGERFKKCFETTEAFFKWRKDVDRAIGELDIQCGLTGEPERNDPYNLKKAYFRWKRHVNSGLELGQKWIHAHQGLVPECWLKGYVKSRLAPIQRMDKSFWTEVKKII